MPIIIWADLRRSSRWVSMDEFWEGFIFKGCEKQVFGRDGCVMGLRILLGVCKNDFCVIKFIIGFY